MATSIAHSRYSRMDVLVVLVSMLVALSGLYLFMVGPGYYEQLVREELGTAQKMMGPNAWSGFESKIRDRYNAVFFESGFYDMLHEMFIPNHQRGVFDSLGDKTYLHQLLTNTQIFAYQMVYRISALEYWASLLTPLAACMIYTGVNNWRISRYKIGGSSTVKSRLYMKLSWVIFLGFILMLVAPSVVAVVGFYLPAILMLGFAYVVMRFISTYQKDL